MLAWNENDIEHANALTFQERLKFEIEKHRIRLTDNEWDELCHWDTEALYDSSEEQEELNVKWYRTHVEESERADTEPRLGRPKGDFTFVIDSETTILREMQMKFEKSYEKELHDATGPDSESDSPISDGERDIFLAASLEVGPVLQR